MKRIFIGLLLLCAVYSVTINAQKNTPKWVEKLNKAVISIETYDEKGNIRKGNGFFIQPTGEAVSDYTLFKGAHKAVVVDMDGRRLDVTYILGADELYDVVRFQVAVPKSVISIPIASQTPTVGSDVYIFPFGFSKGQTINKGSVLETTKVKEKYSYVKLDATLGKDQVSVPLMNADGHAVAIAQNDASGNQKTYGISVSYIADIQIGATDIFNKTYTSIGIRKAWLSDPKEAEVALVLYASQQDPKAYLETLNDFIATFPDKPEGYIHRASHYANFRKELAGSDDEQMRLLDLAMTDLNSALNVGTNKAEGFYNQAKLISNVVIADTLLNAKDWNMQVALDKLNQAIMLEDLPAYRQLEADLSFIQGDFEKAYESYMLVNQSSGASSHSFYLAAKAKQQIPGANMSEVIALIDSAIVKSKASPSEALEYLYENAELKMQFAQYEAAVNDYNQCYSLMAGNVSDAFYYNREQAKFRAGDMKGALADLESAIALNPANSLYYAEIASVYLKLQEPLKAQEFIQKALSMDSDISAYHRIYGVSLLRQEKKEEACKAFNQSKELGDPVVDKLIRENCK